jgi:uncharacterized protein
MKRGFKIMDSDMHIMEPVDLWERYIDRRFLDRAPRIIPIKGSGQPLVLINGREVPCTPNSARDLLPPLRNRRQAEWPQVRAFGFAEAQGFNSQSQLEAMDIEGLDVAVLYPSAPGLGVLCAPDLDSDFAAAICRAYNDWLYEFCQADPARLRGAALVPLQDVGEAVREARRARQELGFPAVFLRSAALPDQAWYPRYWEPFWGELETLGMAVGFHESTVGGYYPHLERFPQGDRLMRHVLSHVTAQMVTMVDLLVGGVAERFPDLHIGFLECNCGWAPSFLARMDRHAAMLAASDAPMLRLPPSEYFRRQCVIGAEGEERELPMVVALIGDDNIVFSTDYPHSDSDFPHAVDEFLELELPDATRRKILWENCARFYRIDDPGAPVAAAPPAAASAIVSS